MRRALTLPNLLSGARLLIAPWVAWTIYARQWSLALTLLFFTGLSDAIDGFLARRFHQHSELGAKLDPLADKALLVSVYIALGAAGELPWWLVILVFARDLLILAMAGYALLRTSIRHFPPSRWGKISTFCQLMLAGSCTLRRAWPDSPLSALVPLLFTLTVIFTVVSWLHYTWTGFSLLRRRA
jgi:cardiolipin synthase